MSVPSEEMMKMIASQRDKASPKGAPALPADENNVISDPSMPPMGAPMSTPEPKMGNREAAMINLSMAMDLLEQSLPAIGSETPDGQKILGALRTMTSIIGQKKGKVNELQPTEIMQLLKTLPQAGGATPEGNAMQQAPMIPGMSPMGMPPPPPGGPPPMGDVSPPPPPPM